MENNEQVYTAEHILSHLEQWLFASKELGLELCSTIQDEHLAEARIMELVIEAPMGARKALEIEKIQGEKNVFSMRFRYKTALFLVALNKVARWGEKLKKLDSGHTDAVDTYLASFAEGKYLRNVHEHDDEYFLGKGRDRSKYVVEFPEKNLVTNVSGTMIIDGEIFLGNKLSVQAMLKAVEKFKAELLPPKESPVTAVLHALLKIEQSPR